MSRGGGYSQSKRERDAIKRAKKKERRERRLRRREEGPGDIEVVEASDVQGGLPPIAEALETIGDGSPTAAPKSAGIPCRLFVGRLSFNTTAETLIETFGEYGEVSDAFIVKDRDLGRSRGFGFVTMADHKDAHKAIEALDGAELDDRRIVVNVARPN